jgi:hypothetical protein
LFLSFRLDTPDATWMALQFDVHFNFGLWFSFPRQEFRGERIWIVRHTSCLDFEH